MRVYLLLFIVLMGLQKPLFGDNPAYVIYNKRGEAVSFKTMVNEAFKADVILFGEKHNNPVVHWLQKDLAQTLGSNIGDSLILGAEMFQRDDQMVINEYINGLIKEKHFTNSANLWNNYETDYKPFIEMARKQDYQFIATNVPRRYANYVAYNGLKALDTFSSSTDRLIAPQPIPLNLELPSYQRIQKMGAHGKAKYLAKAQALKDATMAYFIKQNWKPGHTFLHLNGSFHSDNFEGIYWYLEKYEGSLEKLTITTVEQKNLQDLKQEHKGTADFIICTPKDMTVSY
jgi:uncharacterized iron-regulated protein